MSDLTSEQLLKQAELLMPGGVNSPVRAFRAVGGHPIFVTEAHGSKIVGADGTEYIDYVGSWGPAILGHADPAVVRAVQEVAQKGLSFGAPTELEIRFAEAVIERYPSIEMLRAVSSGTEATMSALRLARGYTGRDIIVKFDGGYHGHSNELLVAAGSGAATFGNPDSAGVPLATVQHTATLTYNDIAGLKSLFRERGNLIAAVIVEPVAGNMGCVPTRSGYLEAIIELCEANGALAIFDEVMTGCRLAAGGAQELYGLTPHLTCLGKVIGGGMPLAVYGGKREIMSKVSPLGPVYQAGTLSGNPLAVTAGLATLAQLSRRGTYQRLEKNSKYLAEGFAKVIAKYKTKATVNRVGSMMTLFFGVERVSNADEARHCDREKFARFFHGMLERGIYLPPAPFEAMMISLSHSTVDLRKTVAAFESWCRSDRRS